MKREDDGTSASLQSSSSDGYDSSSDGYGSNYSHDDRHRMMKRRKRKYNLCCTYCYCIREEGHEKRGHNSDVITSATCKDTSGYTESKYMHCNMKRKYKNRWYARLDCSQNQVKRRGDLNKHEIRGKACKHLRFPECSLKAHDSHYHDFLGLNKASQGQAQHTEDYDNERKRESNYTEESTSQTRGFLHLNLGCPSGDSLTSKLQLLGEDGWFNREAKKSEHKLKERVATIDEELLKDASTRSALQAYDKPPQALQLDGMEQTSLTESNREAEAMGGSTPYLQRIFEAFLHVLSCYDDLKREVKAFDSSNITVDEKSMLEASKMSTSRSCILQELPVPPEEPTKSQENAITSAMDIEVQGKKGEIDSLEVSGTITEKWSFSDIQADNVQIEQNNTISSSSGPKAEIQSSGHKTRKKRAICKMSLREPDPGINKECDHAENASANTHQRSDTFVSPAGVAEMAPKTDAFVGVGSSENIALPGGEEMITADVPSKMTVTFEPQRWDTHIVCNLCHRGPSLLLGEWYSCCCGSRLQNCGCGVVSATNGGIEDSCSGKVHKMCALWSIKVANNNGSLEKLSDIVKLGKLHNCAKCHMNGATLGCRATKCTRVFHYPCAEMLASKLRCRMQCGSQFSVACHEHQQDTHLKDSTPTSKGVLKKAQKKFGTGDASTYPMSEEPEAAEPKTECKNNVDTPIQISSDSDDVPKIPMNEKNTRLRYKSASKTFYYFGNNLLCDDISGGCEAMLIPCTNDVDAATIPNVKYITKSRYMARAKRILNALLSKKQKMALPCKGCNAADIDDPHGRVSSHLLLINGQRHSDTRVDWQGQPMFGRLPYDQYGRLEVGDEMDIIECNFRCPCGVTCVNRELQKGLKLHLEVFRTETHEWAVRTTEAIPRGRFIAEYAGEILTHGEAHKRRGECNTSELRHGHVDAYVENLLVIDWYRMSNVARFLRKSSTANLKMHRIYTTIADPHFYRIGIYASRDVEIGEELSYKGTKCFTCKHTTINFPFATMTNVDRLMNSAG